MQLMRITMQKSAHISTLDSRRIVDDVVDQGLTTGDKNHASLKAEQTEKWKIVNYRPRVWRRFPSTACRTPTLTLLHITAVSTNYNNVQTAEGN